MCQRYMYHTINLLAFGLFAGLLSCEYSDNGVAIDPIESKIIIEAREILEYKKITLFAKTEKIYTCINYPLSAIKETNENEFWITYKGVGDLNLCLTAIGPATSSIDLGRLSNGIYPIELNNGHLKNSGILTVTESTIELSFGQLNGIDISRKELKRVPSNTYWGTIGYHTESSVNLANQFIQMLLHKGAVFNKQSSGDYWYYQIDQTGEIVNPGNHGYHFVKTIIFNYSGNELELIDLVKTGGGIDKDKISINITSFEGKQYNNWAS